MLQYDTHSELVVRHPTVNHTQSESIALLALLAIESCRHARVSTRGRGLKAKGEET